MELVNNGILELMARYQGWKYRDEEEGASMAEYGLLLALVAVVAVATLTTVGTGVKNKFTQVAANLN